MPTSYAYGFVSAVLAVEALCTLQWYKIFEICIILDVFSVAFKTKSKSCEPLYSESNNPTLSINSFFTTTKWVI